MKQRKRTLLFFVDVKQPFWMNESNANFYWHVGSSSDFTRIESTTIKIEICAF